MGDRALHTRTQSNGAFRVMGFDFVYVHIANGKSLPRASLQIDDRNEIEPVCVQTWYGFVGSSARDFEKNENFEI